MGAHDLVRRAAAEVNVAGDHRLHHRRAARNVDDLHVQVVFFKQSRLLGDVMNLLARADAAVSEYDPFG